MKPSPSLSLFGKACLLVPLLAATAAYAQTGQDETLFFSVSYIDLSDGSDEEPRPGFAGSVAPDDIYTASAGFHSSEHSSWTFSLYGSNTGGAGFSAAYNLGFNLTDWLYPYLSVAAGIQDQFPTDGNDESAYIAAGAGFTVNIGRHLSLSPVYYDYDDSDWDDEAGIDLDGWGLLLRYTF